MKDNQSHEPSPSAPAPAPKRGPSVAANVIANWTWYLLVIASGFILPRAIGHYQGKVLLGVWDLGWSMLFYVSLLRMNAAGAVSRYVSRYRALEDWDALNANVNCSLAFLSGAAALALAAALMLHAFVDRLIPEGTPEVLSTAGWVIVILGLSAALEMPTSVFNAVVTGHERFDLLNWLRGARDVLVFVLMVGLLVTGFGVVALALAVLAGNLGYGLAQLICAKRLCPRMQLSMRHWNWRAMKKIAVFGSKSMSREVSRSILYQVNSILLAAFQGPAALAVYTRQRNLVMQVMKLVKQFAQVYIPVSSGLDAKQDKEGLRKLLIQSAQAGVCITLPMMSILLTLGGPLVHLWMGPEYAAPAVLGVLAIGHVFSVAQLGPYSVLEGMGRHGRPALFELIGALFGLALTFVGLKWFGWSMLGAAACVSLSVALTTGVLVPLYACRMVGLGLGQYVLQVFPRPALAALPIAASMACVAYWFAGEPLLAVLAGLTVGGTVTAITYWLWVIPEPMKAGLVQRIRSRIPVHGFKGRIHAR